MYSRIHFFSAQAKLGNRLSVLVYACTMYSAQKFHFVVYYRLAGHPLRGWPARLRGHKGSGLWKVWTVPSPPLPSPPLPSPPLPSPPLPSPPLPSPPLPSPPLPPSRVPNLIKLGPAVWPKRASVAPPWRSASGHFDQAGSSRLAEVRECGAALVISE